MTGPSHTMLDLRSELFEMVLIVEAIVFIWCIWEAGDMTRPVCDCHLHWRARHHLAATSGEYTSSEVS